MRRFDEIPILMVLLPSHDWRENSRIVEQAGADPRFAGRIVFLKINTAQMPQVIPGPCFDDSLGSGGSVAWNEQRSQ